MFTSSFLATAEMGNWILEAGRMAFYMAFPVVVFYYFNQPEYFETFVIQKKREMYPKESESQRQELEKLYDLARAKHEETKYKDVLEKLNKTEQKTY